MVGEIDEAIGRGADRRETADRPVDENLVNVAIAIHVRRTDPQPRPVAAQRIAVEIADRVHRRLVDGRIGRVEIDAHPRPRDQPQQQVIELHELDPCQRVRPVRPHKAEHARRRLRDRVKRTVAALNRGIDIAAAVDRVVAGSAGQPVRRRIADQRVVACTTDRVFDHRPACNREVTGASADIGKRLAVQIDGLVGGIDRIIERVGSAMIDDRLRQWRG